MKLKTGENYYSEGRVAGEYGAHASANPYTGAAGELWENGRQRSLLDYEYPDEYRIDDIPVLSPLFWLALIVAVIAVFGAGVLLGWLV